MQTTEVIKQLETFTFEGLASLLFSLNQNSPDNWRDRSIDHHDREGEPWHPAALKLDQGITVWEH